MPLPKPVLDNRSFDQLVAEGRGLIPRLASTWTDHNASDPGITLLELAAWLSEQNFYRFDRVPDEAARAFLRLLGAAPRPPAVAQSVVAISSAAAAPLALPARVQIGDADQTVLFEMTRALVVSPAKLVQVLAGRGMFEDYTQRNVKPHQPDLPHLGSFPAFGPVARPGAALYLGFDQALGTAGEVFSLHVWTIHPAQDFATRAALIAEYEAQRARIEANCPPGALARLPDWRLHYRARIVWEYHRGNDQWAPLPDVEDETRALSLTGFVRFKLPADHAAGGPGAHHFIRCRLVSGRYECPPQLDRIAHNAVPVEHAATRPEEVLGTTHGRARAQYALDKRPIVPGSTRLRLVRGVEVQSDWSEVLDWDRVGAHDRAYRLDAAQATIEFGDGWRGDVAPAGYEIRIACQVGGGAGGSVDAGTLTRFDDGAANQALVPNWKQVVAALALEQPVAALGGADAPTLPAAQAQAIEMLARREKAVTLADYEALALRTPGVPVGRAKALAAHHPALPCYTAHGVVSVVIVPDCPGPAPLPSRALLETVGRYVRARRLVTAEVHTIAPRYVRVTVYATLHATAGSDAPALAEAARRAIDEFFHPLRGGPQRDGWPIGRHVYRTEILQLLAALPGVTHVTGLALRARGDALPRCGNVEICANDLVAPGRHRIEVRVAGGVEKLYRSDEHECP